MFRIRAERTLAWLLGSGRVFGSASSESLDQRGYTRAGVSYLSLEPDILSGMSLASLISGVSNGEILHLQGVS